MIVGEWFHNSQVSSTKVFKIHFTNLVDLKGTFGDSCGISASKVKMKEIT